MTKSVLFGLPLMSATWLQQRQTSSLRRQRGVLSVSLLPFYQEVNVPRKLSQVESPSDPINQSPLPRGWRVSYWHLGLLVETDLSLQEGWRKAGRQEGGYQGDFLWSPQSRDFQNRGEVVSRGVA